MKLEIHHHYHLSAEDMKVFLQVKGQLADIERNLEIILEKLNFMGNQEQQLNEAIGAVRDAVTEGFNQVNENVDKAAQRVIQRLADKDIDLSEEIGILEDLKTTVRQTASSVRENLAAIAPIALEPSTDPAEEIDPNAEPENEPEPEIGDENSENGSTAESESAAAEASSPNDTTGEASESNANPFPPSVDGDRQE